MLSFHYHFAYFDILQCIILSLSLTPPIIMSSSYDHYPSRHRAYRSRSPSPDYYPSRSHDNRQHDDDSYRHRSYRSNSPSRHSSYYRHHSSSQTHHSSPHYDHGHRHHPRSPSRDYRSRAHHSPPRSPRPTTRFRSPSPPHDHRTPRKLYAPPPPSSPGGHYKGDRRNLSPPPSPTSSLPPDSPSNSSSSPSPTPPPLPSSISTFCQALLEKGVRLHQAQHQNPIVSQVITWVRTGRVPPKSSIPRFEECLFKFRTQFERFVICDGLLCRRKRHPSGVLLHQIVIPHSIVPTVLTLMHSSAPALHFGTQKTIQVIEELCYWHGMRKDIAELCSHCEACQSYRQSAFPPSALPESCAVLSHPSSPPPPPTDTTTLPADISTDPLLNSPVSTCPPPNPPPDMSDIPACTAELPDFTSHPPDIPPISAYIDPPTAPPSHFHPVLHTLFDMLSSQDPGYDHGYQYYDETSSRSPSLSPTSSPPDSPDYHMSMSQFSWSLPHHSTSHTSVQDHPLIPATTSSPQPPATPHIPSHDVHAHNHEPVTHTRSGRAVRPPEYYGNPMPPPLP